MTARAEVRNRGEKPPTATRVAGSEPLKMITPRRPLPHPSVVLIHVAFSQARIYAARAGSNRDNAIRSYRTVWVQSGIQSVEGAWTRSHRPGSAT